MTEKQFSNGQSKAFDPLQQTTQEATTSYYRLLNVFPTASPQQIRRSYRELSKLYHPDTTELPPAIATVKFQQLNEAYATLSSPEKRVTYDLKNGYSRFSVIQPPADLNQPVSQRMERSSAYLDPSDRPLSAGEISVLFALALAFVGCLLLALWVGMTRGEVALQTSPPLMPAIPMQKMSWQPPLFYNEAVKVFLSHLLNLL